MAIDEREFFDRLAGEWDKMRNTDERKIAELVNAVGLKPGDRVLDAGSGTGVLLPFIKKAIGELGTIAAVDFSAQMLACAREKYEGLGGISFHVADIMEFKTNKKFDSIICFNFFPHIQDKKKFLCHISGYLQPGGTLVIMHDISREQVNSIHGESETVNNDRLPAGEIVAKWLQDADYEIQELFDGSDCYFIKAVNKLL